ncbi:MAG: YicC family protein [Desulfobulbaceae bacterium]|nr:YicC family protein [Desulfobulbaceae bacterium]
MIRPLSMTSFGRGEYAANSRTWTAEVKSVNHRFCDIKIRLPRKYGALEERIKKEISSSFNRGHIDVNIIYNGEDEGTILLKTDLAFARQYQRCLQELNEELGLNSPPDLAMIASYRDIISSVNQEEDLDEIWSNGIQQALKSALDDCTKMRQTEGGNLKEDLVSRLAKVAEAAEKITGMIPQLIAEKKSTLEERLDTLLAGVALDQARLAQEVAIMVDKADVTEELVRLQSHISQFTNFLNLDEPTGRRLDFLLQEFLREINTLASKITNAEVAYLSVEIKNELEKMREQVQNLE